MHNAWLQVSAFVAESSLSDIRWIRHRSMHIRVSLRITLQHFFEISRFWFYPRSLGYLISGSWLHKKHQDWFLLVAWFLKQTRHWLSTPTSDCASIIPAHFAGRIECTLKVLWLGRCPHFSCSSLKSALPYHKTEYHFYPLSLLLLFLLVPWKFWSISYTLQLGSSWQSHKHYDLRINSRHLI